MLGYFGDVYGMIRNYPEETVVHNPVKLASRLDLPSLSLDTAVQLDLLQRNEEADRSVIGTFADQLSSPAGIQSGASRLGLASGSLGIEMLNLALPETEATKPQTVGELEVQVDLIAKRLREVASGSLQDASTTEQLIGFCLALHRLLLQKLIPQPADRTWARAQHELAT